MRIGIITQPLRGNFGGLLQNYALQTILKRMGYEVVTIDSPFPPKLALPTPMKYLKRMIKKWLLGKQDIIIFAERKLNRMYDDIPRYINRFECSDLNTLNVDNFDVFVVGSDQVWRPCYQDVWKLENCFLDFTHPYNVKRIAYGASFGSATWEYSDKETKQCADLIKKFDAVSVREDMGVNFCTKYLGIEAKHVLDPTLLLSKNDYINCFLTNKQTNKQTKGTLFTYILDSNDDKQAIIDYMGKYFVPFSLVSNDMSFEERIKIAIDRFIQAFYDAEFVVTDSFHGCVFSIIFNKPFIAIANEERGLARFTSLLKMFGLESRLTTNHDYKKIASEPIDWDNVNTRLKEWQISSMTFLKNAL